MQNLVHERVKDEHSRIIVAAVAAVIYHRYSIGYTICHISTMSGLSIPHLQPGFELLKLSRPGRSRDPEGDFLNSLPTVAMARFEQGNCP